MNCNWSLPDECNAEIPRRLVIDEVLVEYDGPQVISWASRDEQYVLGVASDEGGDFTRWIEAPVDVALWLGVLSGQADLRNIFLERDFFVVDRRSNLAVLRAWAVRPGQVSDDALPSVGARLPRALTEGVGVSSPVPVHMDGKPVPIVRLIDVAVRRGSRTLPRRPKAA